MTRKLLILIPALILLSAMACCTAWFFAALIHVLSEEEIVLDTKVPLEPGQLSMDSTVEEWTDLAVQMLEEQGGHVSPSLGELRVNLVCSPPPQEPTLEGVYVFLDDAYFDGIVPGMRAAQVYFVRSTDAVSMQIVDLPLRRHPKRLELDAIRVGLRDALRMAQQHGGDSFQAKVKNNCRIHLRLYEYLWRISYMGGGDGLPSLEGPTIYIDARTGKVLHNQPQ